MSEHRTALASVVGSTTARRRRWLIGAAAVLGASGLILGGLGIPVSAGNLNAAGNAHASAEMQGDCVTAAVATGGADGSVHAQQSSDPLEAQASEQGTATVSVCRDDLGGTPPADPGGSLPGDGDGVVPGELDGAVPGDPGGSPAGELDGVVTGALEGGAPGGGDGSLPGDHVDDLPGGLGDIVDGELDGGVPGDPGGGLPGGAGDVVPGVLGGLVPDGSGLDPALLDWLAQFIPPVVDGDGPDGNDGGGPAISTSASGTASGSVAVGGDSAEPGAPADSVLGTEVERAAPASVGTGAAPGATLPRTGGSPWSGLLRLIAFVGFGRALFGLAARRRAATDVSRS